MLNKSQAIKTSVALLALTLLIPSALSYARDGDRHEERPQDDENDG